MSSARTVIGILMLISITGLSIVTYYGEQERRNTKEDLIELSKVKYGLFSIDEWKRILAGIITKKVEQFNFDDSNKEQMRKQISSFLYKAIGDFEQRFSKEQSKSITGLLKLGVVSAFGGFSDLKKEVPRFTDQIIEFMNDPKNRRAIRNYIITKLDEYTDKTFAEIDYSAHDQIISKHKFNDRTTAIAGLAAQLEDVNRINSPFVVGYLVLAAATAIFIVFAGGFSKVEFLIITLMCLVLLVNGLLLPMIEIDARIASMRFSLLGEAVNFEDQVLYYKSKSILQVVSMMFTQRRFDLIVVGILVASFSVLFPLSKLIASVSLIYSERLRGNKVFQFLVFKTGKWSMADVMVIAIFMAYIGFSGIITEQLRQIENIALNIDILTTNKSSLQAGFFSFTAFSVLGLLLSHKLQYELKNGDKTGG